MTFFGKTLQTQILTDACAKNAEALHITLFKQAIETIVLLMSPITPFVAEELWRAVGHEHAVLEEPWPKYDPDALQRDEKTIVIQVNGRLRDQMQVASALAQDRAVLEKLALQQVEARLGGKTIRKVIVVPGKLVNVVV